VKKRIDKPMDKYYNISETKAKRKEKGSYG